MSAWICRPVRPDEFAAWTRLYRGYAAFYDWPTSDAHQHQIWEWIHAQRCIDCLVAAPAGLDGKAAGEIQGLAHLREWVRPLRGVRAGYLDDLFVDPAHRGTGAVEALYDGIRAMAVARGWPIVRWTTADDNYRARGFYDQVATRTGWVTYDMTIAVQ